MGFLDDYEPVEDRLRAFWEDHPHGRIETELVRAEAGEYIVKALVWRESKSPMGVLSTDFTTRERLAELAERWELARADGKTAILAEGVRYHAIPEAPDATGLAQEREGSSTVNKTSALENCETSAIGRALANLGYAAKGKRPSREEMSKSSPAAGPPQEKPHGHNQADGVATKGEDGSAETRAGSSPAGETVPPTGTTERLGQGRSDPVGGASSAPLAGDSADTASAGTEDVSSLKPPHPVPASRTFPVDPAACSHKFPSGRWLKWVQAPGEDGLPRMVCPKCGVSQLVAMEGTTADLGAA